MEIEYTTKEVASIVGLTRTRIMNMIVQDQNPHRKIDHFPNAVKKGRDWFIPQRDLNAFLAKRGILFNPAKANDWTAQVNS